MSLNSLRLLKNILLRSVLIGVGFTLLFALVTFGAWDAWIVPATRILHTSQSEISNLVLTLFTEIRFFLVFVLLSPALAIHWTLKAEADKSKLQTTSAAVMDKAIPQV